MSKTIYQTVYGTRIYPVEYIGNHELTESELNSLLDNDGRGLLYSLIIGMFKSIKSSKRNYQIINRLSGLFLILVGILMATGTLGRLLSFLSVS